MASITPKKGLVVPAGSDPPDITAFSPNFEKLDQDVTGWDLQGRYTTLEDLRSHTSIGAGAHDIHDPRQLVRTMSLGMDVYRRAETFPRINRTEDIDLTNGTFFCTMLRPGADIYNAVNFNVKGGTAAKTGATLIRMALYQQQYLATPAAVGLKKVAEIANTTTLFASAEAPYTTAFSTAGGFPADFDIYAGAIYAVGIIGVGQTTAAKVRGCLGTADGLAPAIAYQYAGQTDLPDEVAYTAMTESNSAMWFGVSR